MQLEVISKHPKGPARATPLLFVHGASAGGWVWKPHFLSYFARNGYHAHAVSLRGHGRSGGAEQLIFARLSDFSRDVEQVAEQFAMPPVLIGHSLGGMVVQKVLHRRQIAAPAAVLMASAPPHGIAGCFVHMLTHNPGLLWDMTMMLSLAPFGINAANIDRVRRALFSDATTDEAVYDYALRFGAESAMAVVDLWGLDTVPSRPTLDLPVLVVGAEKDAFISPGALRETARTYRTSAETFPNTAHAMMLDHHWEDAANRMRLWLDKVIGGQPGATGRDGRALAA